MRRVLVLLHLAVLISLAFGVNPTPISAQESPVGTSGFPESLSLSQGDSNAGASAGTMAGPLNQIILSISPHQVVGHQLLTTAQIILLDDDSLLVTDYDLAADPISLTSSRGVLVPDSIDDTTLLSEGVINFLPLGVRYTGQSGSVEIHASNSGIASLGVLVSFSGYDILRATDLFGDDVAAIYSGLPTTVLVTIQNSGDLMPVPEPSVKAFFVSGGGSVKVFFNPGTDGRIDTLPVSLPTDGLGAGEDTLVLVLESSYQPAGSVLHVTDTLRIPVDVAEATEFSLITDSFRPDSVYAGAPFDLSFDVLALNFGGPIDATSLSIHLLSPSDSILATIFGGDVDFVSFDSGVISYSAVEGSVDSSLGVTDGWYRVSLDWQISSGGNIFTLSDQPADSINLLPRVALEYVSGSFIPTMVSSGQEAFFEFDLVLEGSLPVLLEQANSSFHIQGTGFSTSTNLRLPGDSLVPGQNTVGTERVFIPFEQLGETLGVDVALIYRHRGAANALSFGTDFGGQEVAVEELPIVQIVEVSMVAHNAPLINTDQQFQVSCRIANLSTSDMLPFQIRMVSDGYSIFQQDTTVPMIPGEDTVEVLYTVTASSIPNPAEIFRIDIATLGVNRLPPVDNIAQATIQEPALLALSLILRGANQGYVNIGEQFDLIITMVNVGEAGTDDGRFLISTNDIYLGLPDSSYTLEEVLGVGTPRAITFTAPQYDTVVTIDFTLIERPLDLNTNLPALIGDTAFEVNVAVTSLDIELDIEAEVVTSNLMSVGRRKELFRLDVINQGSSSVTDVRLESMSFFFTDEYNRPLSVRSVLEVGNTGLFDGGLGVTRATAGGDRLVLLFDNYVVQAGDTAHLMFCSKMTPTAAGEFGISLNIADVTAGFANGPLVGQPVNIVTSDDSGLVLQEVYTTVEETLAGSFVIKNNPFDPTQGPVEFRYYLSEPTAVEFRMLTLTGEQVYSLDLPGGSPGTEMGENFIPGGWDGRNDEGHMVLNGVYVAVITAVRSGERAILKVAVVK